MPDGIDVISDLDKLGFKDTDLENVFLNDTVKDVIANFAQRIQGKLKDSLDRKGLNVTNNLYQSLDLDPKSIIETDEFIFYKLEVPAYGVYLNEGVNGMGTGSGVVRNSRFGFKGSGKDWVKKKESLMRWINNKSGIPAMSAKEREGFAFGIMRKQRLFGMKPTFWIDDVLTDKVFEDLQNELGKRVGIFINEQF